MFAVIAQTEMEPGSLDRPQLDHMVDVVRSQPGFAGATWSRDVTDPSTIVAVVRFAGRDEAAAFATGIEGALASATVRVVEVLTDAPPPAPAPVEAMRPLDPIAGRWRTRGRSVPGAGPAFEIAGTDAYEWVAGGQFLLHRVDVTMGDQAVDVVEVIGPHDAGTGTWPMRSFDDDGATVVMTATAADGALHFTGATERTTLTVAGDGRTMHADWERTEDGETWVPWLDMDFTRL